MYKLAVIAGPNRGSTFALPEGETSIGRQNGNVIVLASARVSKRHCTIQRDGDRVEVQDQGSSNGTFVNGVLVRNRALKLGDRVSVGEFVLELVPPVEAQNSLPSASVLPELGNVIEFPRPPGMASQPAMGGEGHSLVSDPMAMAMPTDLKGKALWVLDHKVLPFFFGLLLKHEWRAVFIGLCVTFVLANLFISIQPLLEANRKQLITATGQRAQYMAKQIAERNTVFLANQAESRVETYGIDREPGVRVAVLTDLELRILAPANRVGQYLNYGTESTFAISAKQRFLEGRETGITRELSDQIVAAAEPIKILDPQRGRNVVVGFAVVSIDASLSTPGMGDQGIVYSETLLWTALIGFFLFFVLYRLTLKPFQVLNEDIDKVLKGELTQVTREFKLMELSSLWEVINAALQRIPRSGGSGGMGDGLGSAGLTSPLIDEVLGPLKMLGAALASPVLICDADRKIVYMNEAFEEASGIRFDNSLGRDLTEVARDQSLGSLVSDLFDRAMPGGEGTSEPYEFSGVEHKLLAGAMGGPNQPKAYILCAVRSS